MKQVVVDAKTGRPCVDCGGFFPPVVLDFHHRDPALKDFNVSRCKGPEPRLLAEIAKCDLLCANCHRLRHFNEGLIA